MRQTERTVYPFAIRVATGYSSQYRTFECVLDELNIGRTKLKMRVPPLFEFKDFFYRCPTPIHLEPTLFLYPDFAVILLTDINLLLPPIADWDRCEIESPQKYFNYDFAGPITIEHIEYLKHRLKFLSGIEAVGDYIYWSPTEVVQPKIIQDPESSEFFCHRINTESFGFQNYHPPDTNMSDNYHPVYSFENEVALNNKDGKTETFRTAIQRVLNSRDEYLSTVTSQNSVRIKLNLKKCSERGFNGYLEPDEKPWQSLKSWVALLSVPYAEKYNREFELVWHFNKLYSSPFHNPGVKECSPFSEIAYVPEKTKAGNYNGQFVFRDKYTSNTFSIQEYAFLMAGGSINDIPRKRDENRNKWHGEHTVTALKMARLRKYKTATSEETAERREDIIQKCLELHSALLENMRLLKNKKTSQLMQKLAMKVIEVAAKAAIEGKDVFLFPSEVARDAIGTNDPKISVRALGFLRFLQFFRISGTNYLNIPQQRRISFEYRINMESNAATISERYRILTTTPIERLVNGKPKNMYIDLPYKFTRENLEEAFGSIVADEYMQNDLKNKRAR